MGSEEFESWGYARVSTDEQAQDTDALLKQMQRLRDAGVGRIFFDIDKRTKHDRKGLLNLIKAVQELSVNHQIRFLKFTRLDRVAASQVIFYQLISELQKKRIKPVALDDPFDLDSVGGELTVDIRLDVAKHEVKMLGLRIRKERELRRKAKKSNFYAPFGYKTEEDKYILNYDPCICLIDKKQELSVVEVAQLILKVFYQVGSCTQTAKKLNELFGISSQCSEKYIRKSGNYFIDEDDQLTQKTLNKKVDKKSNAGLRYPYSGLRWTTTGIRDWLTNPVLAGGTPYDTIKENGSKKSFDDIKVFWNTHDDRALITFQQHQEIKAIIRSNRKNAWASHRDKESHKINIFQGLIFCAKCNAKFVKVSTYQSKKDHRFKSYYQCTYYLKNGMCHHKTAITNFQLEDQIIDYLVMEAERLSVLGEYTNTTVTESKELVELRSQLQTLESIPGNNPAIETAKEGLRLQIAEMLDTEAQNNQVQLINRERIISAFSSREFWQSIQNPVDKKRLLRECITYVVVDEGKVVDVKLRI
ncbi:fdxN element excision recombinase XisF [Calothrix rhizosoleniae]|uniref:fdxN element excision recombinase XisF n=1 Tax=Calothrix rhizosoleniae TaxID=888997 RepID=UPI000B49F113|nr:fdxN element excision recombinase XisF [Calothrix rhizosoleniae]